MRKLLLIYIALMIGFSPVISHAKAKHSHKHVATSAKAKNFRLASKQRSSKYALVKYSGRHVVKTHIRTSPRDAMVYSASANASDYDGSSPLQLSSTKVLVINQLTGEIIYAKNTNQPSPIASVTKLMTAMVMLDAHLPMDDLLYITDEDVDYLKGTRSKLSVGTVLTRGELLQLALMASENRAAAALAHNYLGGIGAFVHAMNRKAEVLGMRSTHFVDSTGLDSSNVSTAEDLVKMVNAAYHYPEIRQVTTTASQEVTPFGREYPINFVNTNALVRGGEWTIGLSKTGFINEAGRCLVMQAEIAGQPMIMVLLDSAGKLSRIGDANRIRKWVELNGAGSLGENVSG